MGASNSIRHTTIGLCITPSRATPRHNPARAGAPPISLPPGCLATWLFGVPSRAPAHHRTTETPPTRAKPCQSAPNHATLQSLQNEATCQNSSRPRPTPSLSNNRAPAQNEPNPSTPTPMHESARECTVPANREFHPPSLTPHPHPSPPSSCFTPFSAQRTPPCPQCPPWWRSSSCLRAFVVHPLHPSGSFNRNVDPCPGVDSTSICPPCTWATCLTIESPRPVPPISRLRLRSTR
ncbi:MAG: hypothetical protein JWN40_2581 [Phycisphaerales bacterium]|nr:hypothetical protein [Phycisphaerales bacterium]